MSAFYIVYDGTGRIQSINSADDNSWEALLGMSNPFPGFQFMRIAELPANQTEFYANNYVDVGVPAVVPKQTMAPTVSQTTIPADGTTVATISGLPITCTGSITGPVAMPPTQITDGQIDFTADVPGDYVITVTAPPVWLDWSTTIHAV